MSTETQIALDCPYCNEPIYATISWFKNDYSTCPACDKGLAAGQFASVISALEQAMATEIEEMINGAPQGGCCGGGGDKSSCGCSH